MRPWAYQAHFKAHLAHPAQRAHSAMSILDFPDDFHEESRSISAFKKWVMDGQMDHPSKGLALI